MDVLREQDIARQAREIVVRELEAAATEAFREAHALAARTAPDDEHEQRALAERAREWGARGDCYQRAANALRAEEARRPPAPPAPAAEPEAATGMPSDDELLWFLLDFRVATPQDFGKKFPSAQLRSISRRLGELVTKGLLYANSRGYGLTSDGATLARARGVIVATEVGAAANPVPPPKKGGRAA